MQISFLHTYFKMFFFFLIRSKRVYLYLTFLILRALIYVIIKMFNPNIYLIFNFGSSLMKQISIYEQYSYS